MLKGKNSAVLLSELLVVASGQVWRQAIAAMQLIDRTALEHIHVLRFYKSLFFAIAIPVIFTRPRVKG